MGTPFLPASSMGAGCSASGAPTRRLHRLLLAPQVDTELVKQALAAGADPLRPHPERLYTPLTMACLDGHADVVRLLLADERVRRAVSLRSGPHGRRTTAMHAAVMVGDVSSVARLLRHAYVDTIDDQGYTPQALLEKRRNELSFSDYAAMVSLFANGKGVHRGAAASSPRSS